MRRGARASERGTRRRRWLAPLALAVVAAASGTAAAVVELGAGTAAAPLGTRAVGTPVLSVRRVPDVVAAPVADRRLREDLAAWAADAPPTSCAVVVDTDGEVALDLRGEDPLVPASTQKLLTATAALLALGPEARFRTTVVAATPPGGGTVDGDLVVVGGGDPILATADYAARFRNQPQIFTDLDELARRIAEAGVRRVTGSIVGDESRYDRARSVPGWPARYLDQEVTGPLSALYVNDGFVEYPAGPDTPGELVPAPDPAQHAAAVLTDLLRAHGVAVDGAPRSGVAPPSTVEVASVDSPPLRDVVAQMLSESDNSTAELLLKELGRTRGDPTTSGGRAAMSELLAGAGVDLTGVRVEDGSGLSPDNRLHCTLLVELLTHPRTGPVVRDGLATAGRTGTLSRRFAGTALEGVLRAKTGSLRGVVSLAGLVDDPDGALTFAFVANETTRPGVDEAAVVAAQQRLGEILLSWPRVPGPEVLGPRDASEVAAGG